MQASIFGFNNIIRRSPYQHINWDLISPTMAMCSQQTRKQCPPIGIVMIRRKEQEIDKCPRSALNESNINKGDDTEPQFLLAMGTIEEWWLEQGPSLIYPCFDLIGNVWCCQQKKPQSWYSHKNLIDFLIQTQFKALIADY